MNYQRGIKALIYAVVLAWAVVLYTQKQTLQSSLLQPLSTVTSVILTLAISFDTWLWRYSWFRGWLVKRPVIDGTWQVALESDWEDPVTGKRPGTITGFVVINQTLSSLTMRLFTWESTSDLAGVEIVCGPGDAYCVSGVYRNTPKIEVRARSPIHLGAIWLDVDDGDVPTITGQYWTDRKTKGSMTLSGRKKKKAKSFASAVALFGSPV